MHTSCFQLFFMLQSVDLQPEHVSTEQSVKKPLCTPTYFSNPRFPLPPPFPLRDFPLHARAFNREIFINRLIEKAAD